MKILKFIQPSGNGYDLPKGCILEEIDVLTTVHWNNGTRDVTSGCNATICTPCTPPPCIPDCECRIIKAPGFVYWNPTGVAISNDRSVREICYHPHKAMTGTDIFTKNIGFSKHQDNVTMLHVSDFIIVRYMFHYRCSAKYD